MNTLIRSLLVSVCALAFLGVQVAQARTPTPSPTPTPSATSTPAPTPSPQQVSIFVGQVSLDGREHSGPVTARIGDVQCGEDEPSPSVNGHVVYMANVAVVSDEIRPGCGYEGATVEFFLGDQRVMRTGVWHAGSVQRMGFVAGHPFARFGGVLSANRLLGSEVLMPYVGDIPCGPDAAVYSYPDGKYKYGSHVYSNEQQAGCGVEGAAVTFKLLDAQGNVVAMAQEKGTWHVFDGVEGFQELDLTLIPVGGIRAGNVGSGPGTTTDKTPWIGVALAALGLSGIAAGAMLRKRTAAR